MRLIFISFLFLSIISCTDSTNKKSIKKEFFIETYKNPDSSFYYKEMYKLYDGIGLDKIKKSKHSFQFRLYASRQILDIWKTDKNEFKGLFTNFIEIYEPWKNKNDLNDYFYCSKEITQNQVKEILKLIDSHKINTIPDQGYIKNWGSGMDGTIYLIETSNNNSYHFKTYWTPKAFKDINEAILIQNFVDKTQEVLSSEKVYHEFYRQYDAIYSKTTANNSNRCTSPKKL